jgi:hypothetical protein
MLITRCKLSKKTKLRLLEVFVLEVTARSAASEAFKPPLLVEVIG